ncbi:MAG: hypothetical protein QMD77_04920 [Patescibacteria group bacterium]|nr:hypothetical protein [Patescibacteria group bacterium]
MRKTVFVKISGDMISHTSVIYWLKKLTKDYFVVICAGGGSQISQEFEKRGWTIKFGPLGREIKTFKQKQVARDILERNQALVQDRLAKEGISANIIIPVLDIGTVLCHVNGDIFTKAAYLGFDKLFIVTLEKRKKVKADSFRDFPKIKVVGF